MNSITLRGATIDDDARRAMLTAMMDVERRIGRRLTDGEVDMTILTFADALAARQKPAAAPRQPRPADRKATRSPAWFGPVVGMSSTSTQRMRKLRARAGAGLAVLPVETNLVALVDHLIATGRLGEWDSENRDAICEAAGRLLDEIVARGTQDAEI